MLAGDVLELTGLKIKPASNRAYGLFFCNLSTLNKDFYIL